MAYKERDKMNEREEIKGEAVEEQIVTVECNECGHRFDSNPHDWEWEGDTNGPPFQYPPECPKCGGTTT